MRVTPLAIWGAGTDLTDDELASAARADASLTHIHSVCQDANAVYVVAMRYALTGPHTPREIYQYALDWAQSQRLEASVLDRLILAAVEAPKSGRGWVLNALQAAFYFLLKSEAATSDDGATRALSDGVSAAIGLGVDTDTNAAICGALLGATHGLSALPPSWVSAVLSARPSPALGRGGCHRPKWLWSCDALTLTEALLSASDESNTESDPLVYSAVVERPRV